MGRHLFTAIYRVTTIHTACVIGPLPSLGCRNGGSHAASAASPLLRCPNSPARRNETIGFLAIRLAHGANSSPEAVEVVANSTARIAKVVTAFTYLARGAGLPAKSLQISSRVLPNRCTKNRKDADAILLLQK